MAEVIFKDMTEDVEVSSAGIYAMEGNMASFNAIAVCKDHGLDLNGHKSTPVYASNIEEMDLVLTATVNHRDNLKKSYPQLEIYTIKEYAGYDDLDIADPYGYSLKVYEDCFLEIKESLEKICNNNNDFSKLRK